MTNSVKTPAVGTVVLVFNPDALSWALKKVCSDSHWLDEETPGFSYVGYHGESIPLLNEGYGVAWLHETDPIPTDMTKCLSDWNDLHEVD